MASKYPILQTDSFIFSPVAKYQHLLAQGMIAAKINLGTNGTEHKVGYVCNVHLPAYEKAGECRSQSPLSQLRSFFAKFRNESSRQNEAVQFAVMCGDFNLCNVSPCTSDLRSYFLYTK